jgi:hypothetical protein
MTKVKLTQDPVLGYTSRRGRRKCCIGLLKGPVLRPSSSTTLGGSTGEIDDFGNQLTLERKGISEDPSEKDENRVMKSKVIDYRAGPPTPKLEVLDDADREWDLVERNLVCDWFLRGRSTSKFS